MKLFAIAWYTLVKVAMRSSTMVNMVKSFAIRKRRVEAPDSAKPVVSVLVSPNLSDNRPPNMPPAP